MRRRHFRRAPGLLHFLVAMLVSLACAGAQAALITQTIDFTYNANAGSGTIRDIFLPKFDASLGTLDGAEVSLLASYLLTGSYSLQVGHLELSDEGSFGGSARGIVAGSLGGQGGGDGVSFRGEGPTLECTALLSVHFCEDSLPTPIIGNDFDGGYALTDLAAVTGVGETFKLAMSFGSFEEELSSFTDSSEIAPLSILMRPGDMEMVGTVSVTYTYNTSGEEPVKVPDPSPLPLLLLGFLVLLFAHRRARVG